MVSHPEVEHSGEAFADRYLVGDRWVRGPSGDDSVAIDGHSELIVDDSADGLHVGRTRNLDTAGAQHAHGRDPVQVAQLIQLRRCWLVPGQFDVGRETRFAKPFERLRGASCAGTGREHHRADHRDQQSEGDDTLPATA